MKYLVPEKCKKYEKLILFVIFYGILTCFISSNNINSHRGFYTVSEAIVEHGHYYLDDTGAFRRLNALNDNFRFNKHVYYNKQPGQAFICSIPYFLINKLGVTYKNNWTLASTFVSMCTSIPIFALTILAIFSIVSIITSNKLFSIIAACFYGFGTILFTYSDIPHHDLLSASLLIFGFYCLFYNFRVKKTANLFLTLLGGFFTGLSIFFSMNGFIFLFLNIVYVMAIGKTKDTIHFYLGLLSGIIPTTIFNYVVFNNVLYFPLNGYHDFFKTPHPLVNLNIDTFNSFKSFAKSYFIDKPSSITYYFPIYLFSLLGFLFIPNKYKKEKLALPIFCILHLIYLCLNKKIGLGWCMYGPRYTIESIPFALIGFSGYFFLKEEKKLIKKIACLIAQLITSTVGVISIIICSIGSIFGAMYCTYYEHGLIYYLKAYFRGDMSINLPSLHIGVSILILTSFILIIKSNLRHTLKSSLEKISITN